MSLEDKRIIEENFEKKLIELSDLMQSDKNHFGFLYLPKRLKSAQFYEITTANPDTKHPLGPDFSFHIKYDSKKVKIFEDYESGCIYRIFLLPPFLGLQDKIDLLTPTALKNVFLEINLDGNLQSYSLQQISEAKYFPFSQPISSESEKPKSGIGSYYPFCYNKKASIYLVNDHDYPKNLLNLTVDCISSEISCHIKQYSAVSYLKVPEMFGAEKINSKNQKSFSRINYLLSLPNIRGPSYNNKCILICKQLATSIPLLIFHQTNSGGVIISISLILLDGTSRNTLMDWEGVFLSVYTDGTSKPNINVTLSSLFVTKAFTNAFKGAAFGRTKKKCDFYKDQKYFGSFHLMIGYFNFPIPFWNRIEIYLTSIFTKSNGLGCFQVLHTDNLYDPKDTGYLHSRQVFHSGQTDRWREVVKVEGGWGHLVGVLVDIRNLQPNLHGSLVQRWAALQADPVIYVDGSHEPRVKGTGLEDYFSYAHGFSGAENSSYSFVGVPYAHYEALSRANSWTCYRQHLLDPIVFDESLHFAMEGTAEEDFMKEAEAITYQQFVQKSQKCQTVFQYLSLYYYRKHNSDYFNKKTCDDLVFADLVSLKSHSFFTNSTLTPFHRKNVKFIGDSTFNRFYHHVQGLTFIKDSKFYFTLSLPRVTFERKLSLTNIFYSSPFSWNPTLSMVVNGGKSRTWFVAMGATNEEFSLRNQSVFINHFTVSNSVRDFFNFEIEVLSKFNLISFELCSIPLV